MFLSGYVKPERNGFRIYSIMYRNIILLAVLSFFVLSGAGAQEINNLQSYKNLNDDHYLRINYENDFFSATDQYYTQGINIEVVAPGLKHLFLNKALIHPAGFNVRYGLAVEHNAYTPTSIRHDEILYGDRPFAASLFLKSFAIGIDAANKQRFSSAMSLGLIGPGAGGQEMQTSIHKALHGVTPHGWQNQISNDAIVNYEADYEKQLVSISRYLLIDGAAMARVGTLSDKASVGATLMFGFFDSPYDAPAGGKHGFRIYAYEHPEVQAVGYDATLQGGVFDRQSPYTIPTGNLIRGVFQNRFGFVVAYRRLYLEYFQSVKSAEYTTGNYHTWGGIQVAFGL